MKSIKAQIYVSIVCIILGLMLSYQFKTIKNISLAVQSQKIENLSSQLKAAEQQKADLEKNIRELEKKIEQYETNATASSGIANSLKNELDKVRVLAGLTDVEGPGIVVTVMPQAQKLNSQESVEVTFDHLLFIVNELNASGAEAISINNQRIVSTTQIRNGGTNVIIINGVKMSAIDKFEIKAIGKPEILEGAMNFVGGIKQQLSYYGINIKTQKSNNLTILKYNKVLDFKYVKPVKEGE